MNRRMEFTAILVAVFALVVPLMTSAAPPPNSPSVILIQNATVLTVSHGTLEHASILIKDGKIAEVSASIDPARALRTE